MCKIVDTLKFCTCVDKDTDVGELNHYWVLHRYNKHKNENVMGMPAFPSDFNPMFGINAALLENILNTTNPFDKNIEAKRWDKLEIVLCNNAENKEDILYYNYRFTGKVWQQIEADVFDLMNRFDPVKEGEVKEVK
jgi:hypothetical protein